MHEFLVKYNNKSYTIFAKDRNDIVSKMSKKLGCTCRELNGKLVVKKVKRKQTLYYIIDCKDKTLVFKGIFDDAVTFLGMNYDTVIQYVHKSKNNKDFVMKNGYIIVSEYDANDVMGNHDFNACRKTMKKRKIRKFLNMTIDELEEYMNNFACDNVFELKEKFYNETYFRIIKNESNDGLYHLYDENNDISFIDIQIKQNQTIEAVLLENLRKRLVKYFYDREIKRTEEL